MHYVNAIMQWELFLLRCRSWIITESNTDWQCFVSIGYFCKISIGPFISAFIQRILKVYCNFNTYSMKGFFLFLVKANV